MYATDRYRICAWGLSPMISFEHARERSYYKNVTAKGDNQSLVVQNLTFFGFLL